MEIGDMVVNLRDGGIVKVLDIDEHNGKKTYRCRNQYDYIIYLSEGEVG